MDTHSEEVTAIDEKSFSTADSRLALFGHVEVNLTVALGCAKISVAELMALKPGSAIALQQELTEPVTLYLNEVPFAQGELVVIDERFGVRIERVL
jgi:flagellar motor switch protein FliN